MSDTETPVTENIALGPRLARLVGSKPDADQRQVLLRPVLPGVPVVEDRFSEPDHFYPTHAEDMESAPEESRLAQLQTRTKEQPAPSKTAVNTPYPSNSIPDPEPQIKATQPGTEHDSGLSDDTPEDQAAAPQPQTLRPPSMITRILVEKTDNQSTYQPADTSATEISEPPEVSGEKTKTPPEPIAVPARERIVERVTMPVARDTMSRVDQISNTPDKAREESTDHRPIQPETVEMATRPAQPEQTKDKHHAPDVTPVEAPPSPPDHPDALLNPVQAVERIQPAPAKSSTANKYEPKPPVRVEIGALNITLRQPEEPRARPALSVARKAPRAHSIPLRGFGEN